MSRVFVGLDPGAKGCMCLLTDDGKVAFYDFSKGGIPTYSSILKLCDDIVIIGVEKVASMHGQGVKSVFSFGQRLGELEGMLQTLELGYVMPRPLEWQKACGVKPKSGKKGIYEVISKIYPKAELLGPRGGIIDGRCDALGIAHYLRGRYK